MVKTNGVSVSRLLLFVLLADVFLACAAAQSPSSQPIICSAADGIFAAFHDHPLVGLGDYHGLAQEEDFFSVLIRDKRFATDVGNVIVEFGDASQQKTLDRYLAGEPVPYEQLRKVWSDVAGWMPTVTAVGYANFYAAVRAVNLTLPPQQRIHVWLGEPPIDWSKVKTKEDLSPYIAERDHYPAEIIKTEILAKDKKALVIYGYFHLYGSGSLRDQVDNSRPGAFFVIVPHTGYEPGSCLTCFEQAARAWPQPALAASTKESNLEFELISRGCRYAMSPEASAPTLAAAENTRALREVELRLSAIPGDALLYLGPASSLTQSPDLPDLYLDFEYRAEIDRRVSIETGSSLPAMRPSPASPRYIHSQ